MAKHELTPPLLYGISNRRLQLQLRLEEYLNLLFASRAHLVQWREQGLPADAHYRAVEKGVRLARQRSKIFLLNSQTELALELGAQGVHLKSFQSVGESLNLRKQAGREKDFLIGKSVHTVPEALQAEEEGVDYLLLGPIFDPISKEATRLPLGLPTLREAAYMLNAPLFALGGINADNLPYVESTSAVGIAGISWLNEEVTAQLGT